MSSADLTPFMELAEVILQSLAIIQTLDNMASMSVSNPIVL